MSQLLSDVCPERVKPAAAGTQPAIVRGAVVSSIQYWHARTGHHFDGVLLGWGYDAAPAYLNDAFLRCVHDLEELLEWHYKGGAQLLLVDSVYDLNQRQRHLDFANGVPLDISKLPDEKKHPQLRR